MKLGPRYIPSFHRAFVTLLSAVVTVCIFPWPLFHGITLFRGAITEAQSNVPVLRVEVDLQTIDVQVKDSKGNDVLGLSAKNFKVRENGQRQKIVFFDAGNSPVDIAILVDSSNTMNSSGHLGSEQEIAAQFMRTARPGDDISAMDFTDQMGPFQHFTRARLLNPAGVALARAPSHGSALYDAIATALCHLRTSKNLRQAVIVITDGVDQYSRINLEQLIGLVRSSRAQLFMIGLQSRPEFGFQGHPEPRLTLVDGQDMDNPIVVFERLMKESGAESFIPKSNGGLEEALRAVSNMLKSEYTLAYYPQKTPYELRKIEVKVDRHGAHVLARRLVDSQQDASQFVHFDEATCTVSPKFHPYPYEADVTHGLGGMTYRDNFSNPHSGWPIHENSHYVSGGYELLNLEVPTGNVGVPADNIRAPVYSVEVPAGNINKAMSPLAEGREDVVATYGPWWSGFYASVSMKLVPAKSHDVKSQFPYAARPAAGLIFRMNPMGYYALLLSDAVKEKNLSVAVVRRDFLPDTYPLAYKEKGIVPWTAVGNAPTSATELSVQDLNNQISVFVDGQKVKVVRDDTYSQGWVGFVISGPGRATFTSLVVEQK
ncbi:MAG TPA: VWA domain-containing protein [Candidatus Acidoferrales bacterium]|nr:VWA domain-containing protein [Candidatus Acidoferrales bacterium]